MLTGQAREQSGCAVWGSTAAFLTPGSLMAAFQTPLRGATRGQEGEKKKDKEKDLDPKLCLQGGTESCLQLRINSVSVACRKARQG